MKIQYVKASEKKKMLKELKEEFGVTKLPFLLIESGKEKIRGYTGDLSKDEIDELKNIFPIEAIGLYILRKEHSLRLSMDAIHILKDQIKTNIVEISDTQYKDWMMGHDLNIEAKRGTVIIKYKSDFIGSGKSNTEKIINHIPKERRLKK